MKDCVVVGMIETNCWIYPLETEGRPGTCAVIDPGDEAQKIISRLEKLNLIPVYILLSHGHYDHMAALPDLLEAFSSGIFSSQPPPKTGIHRLDAQYLGRDSQKLHKDSFRAAGGDPSYIDTLWKDLPEPDILFDEGDIIGYLKILHIPGHSPGSAAFYDEEKDVLFSGDTLFRRSWGRTDLPGGNESQLNQSLRRLLSMKADITVCPGHGPVTFIKNETGLIA